MSEPVIYTDFTMTCYECDPPRCVNFVGGERVPSACLHELPGVRIELDCGDA